VSTRVHCRKIGSAGCVGHTVGKSTASTASARAGPSGVRRVRLARLHLSWSCSGNKKGDPVGRPRESSVAMRSVG